MATIHPALDLLPIIDAALALPDLEWAVGGAVAMAIHGYVRNTEDLDVFFHGDDSNRVLYALRKAGVRFATIADPYHYAVFPDLTNPDCRIDLRFAWDDIESDALAFPDEGTLEVRGKPRLVKYFPLLLLLAAKLTAGRPKDRQDIGILYERGLFKPSEVFEILERLGGDEDAVGLLRRICQGQGAGPPARRRR